MEILRLPWHCGLGLFRQAQAQNALAAEAQLLVVRGTTVWL